MDDVKKPETSDSWSVAGAKAQLSEVIARAQAGEPQRISKNGKAAAVVVGAEDWERSRKPKQSLYAFLRSSPLVGAGLDLDRDKSGPRDIQL